MSGLILRLRPHEELLINGALVQNGDRKTNLRVKSDGASILRLKDAMRPEEATTPERRAYYVAQLAVAGQMESSEAAEILSGALTQLMNDYRGRAERTALELATNELEAGRLYSVMRRLRRLIDAPAPAAV
ncbi:MAG: flagellar biosynthesis repressor FlbT [Alphaproteobacteria bacterium]|nr:flagellar biosynthesis repressor FlbT [Alphaproteobacteria bacterium]